MTCDPCMFCCYDKPGLYYEGNGCSYYDHAVYDGWEHGCGRPCPGFAPFLTSKWLIWQLEDEAMAKQDAEELMEESA